MEIQFTTRIFKEGRIFVAHALELDVSSCGGTKDKAAANLNEAVRLFLEEADKMGTLVRILQEAGYSKTNQKFAPKFISVQRTTLPLPALTHAKPNPPADRPRAEADRGRPAPRGRCRPVQGQPHYPLPGTAVVRGK
jgi:hypothetical protein